MSHILLRPGSRVRQRLICASFSPTLSRLTALAVLACLGFSIPRVCAITITFSYDERERPAFDPDGTELKRITQAAATLWSSYILDDRSFHFDLSWENLENGRFGQHEDYLGYATSNIIIDTKDPGGNLRNWFFDPTPFENEEFLPMKQTLVHNKSAADIDDGFSGNPQELLEIGFGSIANGLGPAAGKIDLFSIVLHELGHHLGLSYNGPLEDYYDFNPATVGGRNIGVLQTGDYEINLDSVLMTDWPSSTRSERRLPSATDILATWDESTWLTYENGSHNPTVHRFERYNLPRVDFIGSASNSWHNTINWIGGAIPDYDNEVFIRHGGLVVQQSGQSFAKKLHIKASSTLHVKGSKLTVPGDTTIGDFDAPGNLNVGNLGGATSAFQTRSLTLQWGIVNLFDSASLVNVDNDFTISYDGTLMGAGTVLIGNRLNNYGQISGGTFLLAGFGGTLTIGTAGAGAELDLDGINELGRIDATTGNLVIQGPLADDFNSRAAIGETRTMSFSQPWNMMGTLSMRGGASSAGLATLAGAAVTVGGRIEVDGQAKISAPVLLNDPAVVNLPDATDLLIFAGNSTFRGGSFFGNGTVAIQGNAHLSMPNPVTPGFPETAEKVPQLRVGGGDGDPFEPSPDDPELDPTPDDPRSDPEPEDPGPGEVFGNHTTYAFHVPVQVRSGGVLNASVSSAYMPKLLTMSGGEITGAATVNLVGDLIVDQNSRIDPSRFLWGLDATNHRTTIRSGSRLELAPFQITRGELEQVYQGDLMLEPNASLSVEIVSADRWTNAGKMVLNTGSLILGDSIDNTGDVEGNGSFGIQEFENAGRLAPGRILGGIQMLSTDFVQTTAGLMEMTLGNSLVGNGSSLLQTDTAQLAGTLALRMAPGFSVLPGTEIDLITGNSIVGQFSDVLLQGQFGNSLVGEVLYRPNKVSFLVGQAFTSGDFNNDGVVNRTDMEYWKNNYDGKSPIGKQPDGMDFLTWQRSFGNARSSGQLFLMAVPEPGTMLLGLVGLVGVCLRWK